ncbi:MAG: hypothetical protein II566_07320 [Lachnospiraceae bacterium]|nr:hypothetical protein [Lachnospiraceae bacterium]
MDTSMITNTSSTYSVTGTSAPAKSEKTEKVDSKAQAESKSTGFSETAAVYEKSTKAEDSVTRTSDKSTDRSALIAQMKSDLEAQQLRLFDIVKKTISGQGKTLASADDMWAILASGDFTVDAATKEQAQKDIAEDGYWGVNQTSDRIVDFAKALAGDDPAKADKMIEAFQKGYKEATKTWGKTLPDISSRTYDAVMEKMNKWKNGEEATTTEQ